MNRRGNSDILYDITAFGEILIDFTAQGVNGDGAAVYARNPGGAPANVAVAGRRLGLRTAFLGKAGSDMHGRFLKDVLERERVNADGLILDENFFTTLAFVEIGADGERVFSFARKPGADTQIRREELDAAVLDHTRILHVGSLSLTDQPARDTAFYAVQRAKRMGSVISYDPNYRASLWKNEETARKHMRSLIPYVDLMKISDEETETLTDRADVREAARELCRQGVKAVAVTMGGAGAYVCCRDGGRLVSGFKPVRMGDTNGAGDSFWGGFLYKLSGFSESLDRLSVERLAECAKFGNAAASLCVEKKGAIPAMPGREQTERRLQGR